MSDDAELVLGLGRGLGGSDSVGLRMFLGESSSCMFGKSISRASDLRHANTAWLVRVRVGVRVGVRVRVRVGRCRVWLVGSLLGGRDR